MNLRIELMNLRRRTLRRNSYVNFGPNSISNNKKTRKNQKFLPRINKLRAPIVTTCKKKVTLKAIMIVAKEL